MLQAIGVFAVAAIGRAAARLHIGEASRLWANRAQKSHGVKGAGAHFHIQWLHNGTALLRPIVLERQNQALKGFYVVARHAASLADF